MAVTGTGPTLGAMTNGMNALNAVTWGSSYATDTGTLAPVIRQIRRGSLAWRAVGATEIVTTGQSIRFREIVSNTDKIGQAFTSDPVVVGAAAVVAQTAYFGASTASGAGGFRPVDEGGIETDVLSIVSGGATSPAAQVVGGRLSFAGTGAPNGAVITVETAEGNVAVTIATTAGKSIATPSELASGLFLQRSAVAPINLMLRPGAYDINAGGANTSGIFQSHAIPEVAHTTIKRHPGQTSRPYFHKPTIGYNSYWYSTTWITIEGCDFAYPASSSQMIRSGSTSTLLNTTHDITLRDVEFYGPTVPDEDLYDPTSWTSGYAGVLGIGPKFESAYNITLDNVRFHDILTAGDYSPEGLRMTNVTGERIYYDFMRISGIAPRALPYQTACVLENVRATGFFAINNEMFATTGNLEPHNDFMQVVGGGELKFAVFRNCYSSKGPYRGNAVQGFQQNATMNRTTYHETVAMNQGSAWGRNDEGAQYNLVNQCTFTPTDLAENVSMRFGTTVNGTPRPAVGQQRIRNTAVLSSSASPVTIGLNQTDDPASLSNENSYYPGSEAANVTLQGPIRPATFADILLAARPIVDSVLDTNGIGALTTAGEFRNTEIPPLPGQVPELSVAGADLTITVSPSMYYDVLPTAWEWRHRTGAGATWSSWIAATGTSDTATGVAASGVEVMYRYLSSGGVAGVPSEVATVA